MGLIVITNPYIYLNAADFSAYCDAVEFEVDVDEQDATTFGSTGYASVLGGLKSGGLKIGVKNDYAAGASDATLWPLLGTVVTFEIRPTSSAVSTSNPKYTGSVLVKGLAPIAAKVGEVSTQVLDWPTSGAITRATS